MMMIVVLFMLMFFLIFIKIVKCASCDKQSLIIQEVSERRKGLATVLSPSCVNKS